jgi:hypothetical protein
MVADFLAHTTFMMQGRDQNQAQFAVGPGERSDLFHMGFEPGSLAQLKAGLVEQLKAKNENVRGSSGESLSSGGRR